MNLCCRLIFIFLFISETFVLRSQEEIKVAKAFTDFLISNKFDSAYAVIGEQYNRRYTASYIEMLWYSQKKDGGEFVKVDSTWCDLSYHRKTVYQKIILDKKAITLKTNIYNGFITSFTFSSYKTFETYKDPSYCKGNFTESFVNIPTVDSIVLPATIVIPKSSKINRFPILIFVHGSGPSNRDEEIGPNKPFKDLACGLANYNIASIRYEKRSLEYGDQLGLNKDSITIYEETIDDAVSILNYVSTLNYVDSTNIFILGHSQGAMCAPKIMQLYGKEKGGILMAAPARSLPVILLDQINHLLKTDSSDFKTRYIANTLKYQVSVLESDSFSIKTKSVLLPFGQPAKYWLSLKTFDQLKTAREIQKPLLILQGEKDYQVTMTDFNLWQNSVDKSSTTFKHYPKLNHLFFKGGAVNDPLEYERPSHVDNEVIKDIAEWVKEKSKFR